jgi:hypothetical protein
MKVALRGLSIAAAVSVMALGLASMARADDFVAECKKGTSAADPDKACNCMSEKVTGAARADAIEGMRSMNATAASGKAPDPKALPANQQTALQAVVSAGQQCR